MKITGKVVKALGQSSKETGQPVMQRTENTQVSIGLTIFAYSRA